MWVTSHFHTYFLLGFVVMLFAFVYDYFDSDSEGTAKFSLTALVIGGYGIILMFALAGIQSVPRRYSNYDSIPYESMVSTAKITATGGAISALVLLVGILVFYKAVLPHFKNKW